MTDNQQNWLAVIVLIGVLAVIATGVWYAIYQASGPPSALLDPPEAPVSNEVTPP
jgi:uncharacterized membrane protein